MEVNVEIKAGRSWVKRAMLSSMGVYGAVETALSNTVFQSLLLGRHSPIDEYEVWVDCIVPERVHTHVVRHKEIGKYVSTSRPDISYMKDVSDGNRGLSLRIPGKRLIEIMMLRKCFRSWGETTQLFDIIAEQLTELDPALEPFMVPSCIWFGFCVETHPDNKCKYFTTRKAGRERRTLMDIGRGEVL